MHDTTTVNRQGDDVDTHYRSVIFYNAPGQKSIAEKAIEKINARGIWMCP